MNRRQVSRSHALQQVVILAGGLATRMRPLTTTIPKMLLDVAGRPFADWQLERLHAAGYRNVVLCVAYLGDQVRAHVGDGARYGLQVVYSDEGPTLRGTGGALCHAWDLLEDSFLVTYGDSWLPFDYAEPLSVLRAHDDCDAVMSVYRNQGKHDRSNVKTDGQFVLAYEKGVDDPAFDHIDYGALAFHKQALERWRHQPKWDLAVAQTELAAAGRVRAVVASERFYEIGSPEGLASLTQHLQGDETRSGDSAADPLR